MEKIAQIAFGSLQEMPQVHLQARQIFATCEFKQRAGEVLAHRPPVNDKSLDDFVHLFPNREHAQRVRRTLGCQLRHLR